VNANVVARVPAWRNLVWVGVVASVVAWTWAWYVGHGAQVFMVVVAIAAVAFAYKAVSGMRVAIVGLMVAAFAMFLASLYWMFWANSGASAFDMASVSLFPMFASAVLLVGAAAGFRHTQPE
jgi:hypothetical protein